MADDLETAVESLRKGCDAIRALLHKAYEPTKPLSAPDRSTLRFLVDQLMKDGKSVQQFLDEKPPRTSGPQLVK